MWHLHNHNCYQLLQHLQHPHSQHLQHHNNSRCRYQPKIDGFINMDEVGISPGMFSTQLNFQPLDMPSWKQQVETVLGEEEDAGDTQGGELAEEHELFPK